MRVPAVESNTTKNLKIISHIDALQRVESRIVEKFLTEETELSEKLNAHFQRFVLSSQHKIVKHIANAIVRAFYDTYHKFSADDIDEDFFFNECYKLSYCLLIFMTNSVVFQYNGEKFIYQKDIVYNRMKESMLDLIYNVLDEHDLVKDLIDTDIKSYIDILYKTMKSCVFRFNGTFVGTNVFCSGNRKQNLSHEPLEVLFFVRCQIINYIFDHPDAGDVEIGRIFHVDRRTVKKVREIYTGKISSNMEFTYADLTPGKTGPEAKEFDNIVTAKIWAQLIEDIVKKLPRELNLNFSSWTCKCVKEYLHKYHEISVNDNYIYYLFRRFEVSSKFAKRVHPKRDLEEMANFIKNEYERICQIAKRNGERIIFGDQTYCQQGYDQRGYAPIGVRANLDHSTTTRHTNCTLFSMIGPDGFNKMIIIEGSFNAECFRKCLKMLHDEYKNDKFVLILDNSRVHHAVKIRNWLLALQRFHKDFIRLEFIPAYCPEINPVEFLNNDYKGYLRRLRLDNKEDVIDATKKYISQYIDGDEQEIIKRVKSFFNAVDCKYSIDVYNRTYNCKSSNTVVNE